MSVPKISGFLIGLGVMSFVVVIFMFNLSSFSSEYGISYDNSSLQTYDKLQSLNEDLDNVSSQTTTINTQDLSFKDVVGGYFSSGYNAMIASTKGVNTFISVADQGVSDANLGGATDSFRNLIIYALLVTITIGIVISAIIKKDI